MKSPASFFIRALLAAGGLAAGFALPGCDPDNNVAPGAPQLVSFGAVDSTGAALDLGAPDGGVPVVTPLAHFVAVFDRLLDPTPLASITDAGVTGKPGAVLVEAPGFVIPADITYVPNSDEIYTLIFPPGPQVIAQPTPSLPSGAQITVRLQSGLLLSKDGRLGAVARPGVADTLRFATTPFDVTLAVPAPDLDGGVAETADAGSAEDGGDMTTDAAAPETDAGVPSGPLGRADSAFVVKATFTNYPGADIAAHAHVVITDASGAPVPTPALAVAADPADATTLTIAPAMGAAWPPGATVTVTIDATAADGFGVALGRAVAASFVVEAAP